MSHTNPLQNYYFYLIYANKKYNFLVENRKSHDYVVWKVLSGALVVKL